jgi:3-hydroxyisobutyrate dehydrogenase-like beta-hydroxyacid dehydrogenase
MLSESMMSEPVVALLHPGEMGSGVGGSLAARGMRVLFASDGRSAESLARAKAAGLHDGGNVRAIVRDSEIVLSICPPHAALDVANEIAQAGFKGIFVDANAIAPATARTIGEVIDAAGGTFVDGGIIGPPPKPGGRTRLYLSGPQATRIANLFAGTAVGTAVLDQPVGAASAVKACYAAWTKGSIALMANIRALAAFEGVDDVLLKEWSESQGDLGKRSTAITTQARKAWRWIAEMEELAKGFRTAGLPDGFHLACADLYTRLIACKDAKTEPTLNEIRSMLLEGSRGANSRT